MARNRGTVERDTDDVIRLARADRSKAIGAGIRWMVYRGGYLCRRVAAAVVQAVRLWRGPRPSITLRRIRGQNEAQPDGDAARPASPIHPRPVEHACGHHRQGDRFPLPSTHGPTPPRTWMADANHPRRTGGI